MQERRLCAEIVDACRLVRVVKLPRAGIEALERVRRQESRTLWAEGDKRLSGTR